MSHNFCLLLITQQSYWSDLRGCIQFRLTLAILSIEIILVPSMTSHKGKVKCPHFIATKVPLIYIYIYIRCKNVCEKLELGVPSSEPSLQLLSSSVADLNSILQSLQLDWSPWQNCFLLVFLVFHHLGASWVSRPHSVCRFIRCICLFKSNWSGYPTASQHCSHNQGSHPKIC